MKMVMMVKVLARLIIAVKLFVVCAYLWVHREMMLGEGNHKGFVFFLYLYFWLCFFIVLYLVMRKKWAVQRTEESIKSKEVKGSHKVSEEQRSKNEVLFAK